MVYHWPRHWFQLKMSIGGLGSLSNYILLCQIHDGKVRYSCQIVRKALHQHLKRYIHLPFMGIVVSILQITYKPSLVMPTDLYSRRVQGQKIR